MTGWSAVFPCSRCGLDLLTSGGRPTSPTTVGVTPPSSVTARRQGRSRFGASLVAIGVVVALLAVLAVTILSGSEDGDRVADGGMVPGSPAPLFASPPPSAPPSPAPVRSVVSLPPQSPAGPGGDQLTITGSLTIVSPATDQLQTLDPGVTDRRGRAQAPWAPVRAELDALEARKESGELSQDEFMAAYRTIGCAGSGEFSQFSPGRTIDLLDAQGEVLASGQLQSGSIVGSESSPACRMPFTIPGVPSADAYTLDLGVATLSYTRARLEALGWDIQLEFGARD